MSLRRVLFSFAVAFAAALAVFTLPRFVYNSVTAAVAQTPKAGVGDSGLGVGERRGSQQQPAAASHPDSAQATPNPNPQAPTPVSLPARFTGLLGMALFLAVGYLLSRNRRAINWRTVGWGLGLQVAFAVFVLRVPFGIRLFRALGDIVTRILSFSYAGSEFVFGDIGAQHARIGVVFAFQILPAIIFISALMAILYYLGIMQVVVRGMALAMNKVLKASGAESLNVAASIFMGQTEAPLTIRPYLNKMTQSELMTVMTAGMAHVSGSIMAAYIAFGIEARHLLTAVIMTAPGTIVMAKLLQPETEQPETLGVVKLDVPKTDVNVVDAASRGTGEGLHLMLNVIAMLISFIAIIALLNGGFAWVHGWAPWFPASIQTVLGWIGRPVAWAMGVPWHDAGTIGSLLGTRAVLNEFIAFAQLGPMRAALDPRSFTIASFALCGFANVSSVGIQIGGIGALAPERKHDLARLGFRAMLAGTLANFMSACIAGMML
ncbi:MAG TPA: NupC/NupG family nucleoside CNT transporter [Candidatus Methylomirabilis sp.]|nr:NupC/NupG family nucleoside CNT transporter [Gemmatimonadales bacterium]HYB42687.1 NupC/NupG family nucleoside CNT transporter [Candidatus Methylomirabilis sp.]